MVIRMQVNNKTILFLGDTGKESSEKLIKEQPQKELKADIVQMAHHGQNGATEELYKIIQKFVYGQHHNGYGITIQEAEKILEIGKQKKQENG